MRNFSKIERIAALGSVLKDRRVLISSLRGGMRSFSPMRLASQHEELEFIHGKVKMRLAAELAKQTPRSIAHWLQFSDAEIKDMLNTADGMSHADCELLEVLVAKVKTPRSSETDSRHPSSE